ncbi:hypothetical protein QP157_06865 [Sphingomonas sp. LR61]
MSEDLAPRGWRNYHRSRRANEVQRDLTSAAEDIEITDWWLDDETQSANT